MARRLRSRLVSLLAGTVCLACCFLERGIRGGLVEWSWPGIMKLEMVNAKRRGLLMYIPWLRLELPLQHYWEKET